VAQGVLSTPFFVVYYIQRQQTLVNRLSIFKLCEAGILGIVVSFGVVATCTAIAAGEAPSLVEYATMIAPPYESDDKRIYPDIWEEEEAEPLAPQSH
tara:strand:+ start:675 stop:965 length:291 start_codon:yes stop_codon:yes gene_type:complete